MRIEGRSHVPSVSLYTTGVVPCEGSTRKRTAGLHEAAFPKLAVPPIIALLPSSEQLSFQTRDGGAADCTSANMALLLLG
jgi:hypothetical protein